ncbi:ATP-dependent DNA ligase [Solicola gregarius]|uniref:DNA ligase (ATP) n=1 Tax=Solicola gregarius TaxID=2908642 RepID=A0AA46TH70_9ACTN|nr:ATP-dependent DNA ligase [Solicola gregarius]UYM04774.1 ATP-dependent DNA ligase [Solicola gregarius]
MTLPLEPPLKPMLAKSVARIPTGSYAYEPKWDGFRCIVFRDGDSVELYARSTKPLTRYFPEVARAIAESALPERCVLDGEVVIVHEGRLEFEYLLNRIHPAESRVNLLATETPASYIAFDLLADGDDSLLQTPYARRRERLAEIFGAVEPPVYLTPVTLDADEANAWFDQFEGAGLDGVVAKLVDSTYAPGERSMLKIKHTRTADVVVAGYRLHKTSTPDKPLLGSLLLGLYDDRGTLQHVGVSASFRAEVRAEMIGLLDKIRTPMAEHPWGAYAGEDSSDAANTAGDRRPGGESRWNAGKDLSFVPLEPRLVAEVGYDHLEGTRFRHTTQFKRWRTDRDPESCTYEQLEEVVSYDLSDVLRSAGKQG